MNFDDLNKMRNRVAPWRYKIAQICVIMKRQKKHYVGLGHYKKYSRYQKNLFASHVQPILPENKQHLVRI